MTKKKFLREMNRKLYRLKRKERKKYISDYEEILSDKMEDGMTEEEAVRSLGSIEKITGEIMENIGKKDCRRVDFTGVFLTAATVLSLLLSLGEWLLDRFSAFTLFFLPATEAGTSDSISIIGGADGPTSIFLAGKVNTGGFGALRWVTVVLLVVTVGYFLWKYVGRRKEK